MTKPTSKTSELTRRMPVIVLWQNSNRVKLSHIDGVVRTYHLKIMLRGMWLALGSSVVIAASAGGVASSEATYADVDLVFKAHCVRCHAGDGAAASLDLSSFKGLMRGGASGKAVVPHDADKSLLVTRLMGLGGMDRMPLGFTALSDREIRVVRDWIKEGAVDGGKHTVHWAFVKPVRPAVPATNDKRWVKNPIDSFVLARLEKERLTPSPEADRTTLIRRVTLDLTGLPPTLAEIDNFISDKSPDAYEKVVDRLFASPHYGEKMALPWLDAARYADSNGFQMEGDTYQYVWRDWVVRAMNADMPFDQFTRLQLAGDLVPGAGEATKQGRDYLIATGFNRNHMLNGEGGAIPEEQRNIVLFDRVDTASTVWTGLTMACARCHDHKYDPFTQRDYYSMMAYFNNVSETGVPEGGVPYSIAKPWIYAGSDSQMTRLQALRSDVERADLGAKAAEDAPATKQREAAWLEAGDDFAPAEVRNLLAVKVKNDAQKSQLHQYFMDHVLGSAAWLRAQALRKELTKLEAEIPRPMVMNNAQPRETHILNRGNYTEPLTRVSPAVPALFKPVGKSFPPNRLGLAEWICSPENPLTARVQVNRYWQVFFGRGLVKTSENFGVQGSPPSHPKLLDWLATEFVRSGWDVKGLQKLIVMSSTYRQSSKVSAALLKRDPDNELLARGARFRMPSMVLRDMALAESGLINLKLGGKPVYPYQPPGIWSSLAITDERDFTYPQSHGDDLYRRSIYTFWRRTVAPGDMFDSATRQVCTVNMAQTSTPLHALTMMNDTAWVEAGRAMAARAMKSARSATDRLTYAFRLACARRPRPDELAILKGSLDKALAAFAKDPASAKAYLAVGESPVDTSLDPTQHAAYAAVCLSILNLDEAMTRE